MVIQAGKRCFQQLPAFCLKSVYTGSTVLKIHWFWCAVLNPTLQGVFYVLVCTSIQLPLSVIVTGCIFVFDTLTSEIGDGCCNLLQHVIKSSLCGTLMVIGYCVHGLCCRC